MNKKRILLSLLFTSLVFIACPSQPAAQALSSIKSPNQQTPLSTVLTLNQVNIGTIEVLVKGKTSEMDIAYTYPANYGTVFPIHGLYADYDNTIVITGIDDGIIITKNIKTKSVSASDASTTIDTLHTPDAFNQDLFFYNSGKHIAASDRKGDIRYFQKVEKSSVNHLQSVFFDETRNEILLKDNRGIYDLLGNALIDFEKFDICHDSIKKGDNYIILTTSTWGDEDRLLEITPAGTIVNDKTLGSLFRNATSSADLKILNQIVYDNDNRYIKNGKQTQKDWAHINSIIYDNTTDILYVSSRNLAIIAIDYDEWELLWWMADDTLNPRSSSLNLTDVPSLDPYRVKGDGQTDGPKNQHALLLKSNGNIAMFDNQGDEKTNPKGSRYVEYAITGEKGNWQATKVKEYRNANLYSQVISDADLTGDNHQNILLTYGRMKKIIEVDANNEIIFEITLPLDSYRGAKMPLYPYTDRSKNYSIEYNEKEGL